MFKLSAILLSTALGAGVALAADMQSVAKALALKDGSTVYIFKDGKMSMEDRRGRTVSMKPGVVMETSDGQRLVMIGNELARLDIIRADERGGGR